MKKIFIGIILSIILTLCFYNVQAESEQTENVQEESVQVTSEIVSEEVQNKAKEKLVRSVEGNGIQPYAEEIYRIYVIGNSKSYDTPINLILGEHETEKIKATYFENNDYVTIPDAKFSIEDTSIATIDETGVLKAKKAGTTTITATAAGKETKKEVKVYDISFADFSSAKIEQWTDKYFTGVKISGIKSLDTSNKTSYYCAITSEPIRPDIIRKDDGYIVKEGNEYWTSIKKINGSTIGLEENKAEGIIISDKTKKEILSTKKAYLWVIQQNVETDKQYVNEDGKSVYNYIKLVVEGKEMDMTNVKWTIASGDSVSDTTNPKSDPTQAPGKTLPKTGIGTVIIAVVSIIAVSAVGFVTYTQYDKYKQLSKFVK